MFTRKMFGSNVFVLLSAVNLDAMNAPDFTGVASGGSPGFVRLMMAQVQIFLGRFTSPVHSRQLQ